MHSKASENAPVTPRLYKRAKATAAHFQIARSTLWQWCKRREGFPQPLKAGEKVTLFDINAIDAYLKAQAWK